MQLGYFLLWVAMGLTLIAMVHYIIAGRGKEEFISLGRSAYYGMTTATVVISAFLMWFILGNQFQYQYVSNYSSKNLELVYKISAFWAGQEGSFLLWALFGALIGLMLIRKAGSFEPWLMAFWSLIQAFFFTLMLIRSPFAYLNGWMPGMPIPADGAGLNPLLKNPWMAIHPPLVFLGYAAMAIPAAFVVAALIKRDYTSWANRCLPWTIFAWTALGSGIFIGGFWAYEVLGWGGYWGWDPVENASLIPWLTGTALLHGMLVERSRGTLRRTNMVMAIISFLLIIYATFLTRSGVLSEVSVHSFSDLGVNGWLIVFILGFTAILFGLYFRRAKEIPGGPTFDNLKSKEFAFFLTLLLLTISAFLVFFGTSVPVPAGVAGSVGKSWSSPDMPAFLNKIGAAMVTWAENHKPAPVNPEFYVRFNTPIAIALAALMALAPVLAWSIRKEGASAEGSTKRAGPTATLLVISAVVAAVAAGILLPKTGRYAPVAAAIALGLFSLIALSINGISLFGVRGNWKRMGGFITHVGIALMFIGIIFSNQSKTNTLLLPENGDTGRSHGYTFQYKGLEQLGSEKAHMKIHVSNGRESFTARPTLERTRDGVMKSPYIQVKPLRDLYIAPEELAVIGRQSVNPIIVIDDSGQTSRPAVKVPGTDIELTLQKMNVEGRMAMVEVKEPGKAATMLQVGEDAPTELNGYTFTFDGFTAPKGHKAMGASFGVNLSVTGPDAKTAARIKVSNKPLISVLWAGLILVLIGGTIAMFRRMDENRKIFKDDGDAEAVETAKAECEIHR